MKAALDEDFLELFCKVKIKPDNLDSRLLRNSITPSDYY